MENNLEMNVAEAGKDVLQSSGDKETVVSRKFELKSKKLPFNLEKNSGNILTIHHTIKENEKMLRIVMCVGCFDMRSLQLVAIDRRGTIFVFDFQSRRYWRHEELVPKPSAIMAMAKEHNRYIVGNKEGMLVLLDVEISKFIHSRRISEDAINEISFPGQPLEPKNLALIRTGYSAVLVDLDSFACTHRLDFDKLQMSLKFASFLPQSEHILTCFNNDSIHIWSSVSLEVIRVIYPIRLRDKKLQLQTPTESVPELSLDFEHNEGIEIHKHLCNGTILSYAYQNDGSNIAITTTDNYLLFLSPYTFELTSMLRLKDFVLVQLVVMPKPNDSLIMGLTTRGFVILMDCSNIEFKLIVEVGPCRSLRASIDGKYLAISSLSGELSVWSLCHLIEVLKSQRQCMTILRSAFKKTSKPFKVPTTDLECKFQEEVKKLLTPLRLQQILQEYHCYPAKYRILIWCSLLQLPSNKVQYQELLQMGTPSTVAQRSRCIQLKNDTLKRALVKCWSCLSQWCKVLAHNDALPDLIFPFVKMFQQNPLITFELCVTLILNQFQLFFEYHPLEPSNYVGFCANVLQHYDKELFNFFKAKDVTPTIYAWILLKCSFSEVLDEDQWLCFWDNVLSAPTYYLIFVVVAYNIMQKEIVMRLPDKFIIERFYHEQNPIDVRKLISKAFKLLEKCPNGIHPKRYMQDFQAIPSNVYPKFLNYPNKYLRKYEEKVEDFHNVHSVIESRMRDLEMEELEVLKRLENGLRQEEHEKRLKEVEKYYQDSLKREEERINCQRKMLLLYQKEIRQRKGEVAVVLQEAEQRKAILEKEHELNFLQNYIEQERMRNDINLMWAEEELYNQDLELRMQKALEKYATPPLTTKYQEDIQRLCRGQKLLNSDLKKISSSAATIPKAKAKPKTKISQQTTTTSVDIFEQELEKCQMEFLTLTGRKTN